MTEFVNVLSKRQRSILTAMKDGEEMIWCGNQAAVGLDFTNSRLAFSLLRMCAIAPSHGVYYHITGTGLKLLEGDTSDLDLIRAASRKLEARLLASR